jgi:hypothetical protein
VINQLREEEKEYVTEEKDTTSTMSMSSEVVTIMNPIIMIRGNNEENEK